jgi:hypothetical protein
VGRSLQKSAHPPRNLPRLCHPEPGRAGPGQGPLQKAARMAVRPACRRQGSAFSSAPCSACRRKANEKGQGQNPHPLMNQTPKGCGTQDHVIASRGLHPPIGKKARARSSVDELRRRAPRDFTRGPDRRKRRKEASHAIQAKSRLIKSSVMVAWCVFIIGTVWVLKPCRWAIEAISGALS